MTTAAAVLDLYNGEAQAYYEEYQTRLEIMEDETITDAVLAPFQHHPYLLYFEDITEDPEYWSNLAYAIYYGKNTVRLAEE